MKLIADHGTGVLADSQKTEFLQQLIKDSEVMIKARQELMSRSMDSNLTADRLYALMIAAGHKEEDAEKAQAQFILDSTRAADTGKM
jgi:hypothetical protein